MAVKKKPVRRSGTTPGSIGIVRNESLRVFGKREMGVYAEEVNLARAVPDLIDGLKPVQRRIMWAASLLGHDFVKTARLVGDVIGRFHPHGDKSVADAITTIVQSNCATLQGKGNWGSLIDPAAAMRYCFTGDTRVSTDRGLLKMSTLAKRSGIKDGQEHIRYVTTVDTKATPEKTSHFVNSGVQAIVKLTTESGYDVSCTPNEPFYVMTPEGFRWKDASHLQPGEWVCLKRGTQLQNKGSHQKDLGLARFLGYMVGDGYMNAGQKTIGFNQVDDEVFGDFIVAASKALSKFKKKFLTSKQDPRSYGKLVYNQFNLHSVEARTFLKGLGLVEGTSYDQRVPEVVFQGSTEFMAAFLSALFEADGAVFTPKDGTSSSQVFLHSVSLPLLQEVSLLLRSQFGIFGKVCSGGEPRLLISGAENLDRFVKHIGFRSTRKNSWVRINLDALSGVSTAGTISDCVPFAKELGFSRSPRTRYAGFRAKVAAGTISSPYAKLIAERDYYFDRVESVVDAGEAQVWDLTVPGTHSFVANGFVVHNTNCRLSSYGWSFFDSDYVNKEVTSFVPNYDDTTHEPVSLPALLPNVLINGGEGIGVGTTTKLPTFTPESLVAVMTRLLKGEKLNSMDFVKTLKYANRYGGRLVNSKENKEAWLSLFSSNSASIQFEARLDIDRDSKSIEIDDWPLGLNPVKFIEKVRTFQGVDQAFNHKGATGFRIEMNRSFNYAQFDSLVAKVQKATQVRRAFKINVTHRHSSIEDGVVKFDTKYLSLSVPQLLVAWMKERIALEKRSLEYRIKKQQAAIDYSTLLIFASNNLDHIFKSLRAPDSKAYLVKHLRLSPEDADKILELKVRQLSKLDQDAIKAKLKEQQAFMKQLRSWLASPKAKVLTDTQAILAAIEKDRKFEIAKDRKMSVAS